MCHVVARYVHQLFTLCHLSISCLTTEQRYDRLLAREIIWKACTPCSGMITLYVGASNKHPTGRMQLSKTKTLSRRPPRTGRNFPINVTLSSEQPVFKQESCAIAKMTAQCPPKFSIFRDSLTTPMATFPEIFHGLWFVLFQSTL